MKFLERYQVWLHVIGWAVFIGLPFVTFPDFAMNRSMLLSLGVPQLITSVCIMAFFYYNLYRLTPDLLTHPDQASSEHTDSRTRRFWLIFGLVLLAVAIVKWACFFVFPPTPDWMHPPDMPAPAEEKNWGRPPARGPQGFFGAVPGVISTVISFCFASLVSSLIALGRQHARSREAQQQMVYQKVSAELAVLKLQVSPHFLFNTLNNIRWLARKKSDQTEEAIVTLSQLLRYMIYQARHDKVPLRQEVQHLQHYIDLQKMRLTTRQAVSFTSEGDIDAYQIEPLLFIAFVENAFKYGLHSQQPSQISISYDVRNDTLTFCCENPIFVSATPHIPAVAARNPDSGIGIDNVRKRLALHYPDRHELHISRDGGLFRIGLTLHLKHDTVALHRH
ncbi:hypothetical protein GCM10023189_57300 [Nibrella saemangeumensis]|uniref:Signal transduction histidine kinase internal region domain-containing protein n=1 Tax=Nibrella saemangeumensis TaxID=1084526 RepID=A0ABP8NRR4_9BACT